MPSTTKENLCFFHNKIDCYGNPMDSTKTSNVHKADSKRLAHSKPLEKHCVLLVTMTTGIVTNSFQPDGIWMN